MSIVDNVKEVVSLVQKIDNIELLRQILTLQAEVMKLVEENAAPILGLVALRGFEPRSDG